ncbi:MAG TPA: dihydrolipoamide acetyltransferase family protein [Actinomycetota bacterium]|nr:dihydrolipoamide acetyltransferase family protein [Actinomycetota bacterium]
MRRVFTLPDLGEGLEGAEVSRWLVAEGDPVTLNQPLVEVNTEKALVEIPSPYEGVVSKLHAGEGDQVRVGQHLVTFEVQGEEEPAEDGERKAVLVGYGVKGDKGTKSRPSLRPPGPRTKPAVPAAAGKALATPAVRKLAKDLGVDLAAVSGTGPEGRITREDVQAAASAPAPAPVAPRVAAEPGDERIAVRGVRRLIAEKMTSSWTQIPHVTTYLTVDCTEAESFRAQLPAKVTLLPVVVRALAEVVKHHPKLNSSYDAASGEIIVRKSFHAGIATDTPAGLMVAVVRDAGEMGIATLAREMAAAVSAAREGTATPQQLTGSTLTVSNVGTFGAEFGTPIINAPEAAILALGVVESRPLVYRGTIEARLATTLSLSFDHRVLDGAEAGYALAELREHLEDPEALRSLPAD